MFTNLTQNHVNIAVALIVVVAEEKVAEAEDVEVVGTRVGSSARTVTIATPTAASGKFSEMGPLSMMLTSTVTTTSKRLTDGAKRRAETPSGPTRKPVKKLRGPNPRRSQASLRTLALATQLSPTVPVLRAKS